MRGKSKVEECGCKTVAKTVEKGKTKKLKKGMPHENNLALADAYVRLAAFRQHDGTCGEGGCDLNKGLAVGTDDEIKVRMRKDAEVERAAGKKAKSATRESENGITGLMFALAPETKKKEAKKATAKKIPAL